MRPLVLGLVLAMLGGVFMGACGDSSLSPDIVPVEEGSTDSGAGDGLADAGDGADAEPTCVLPGVYGSAECERCLKARCCDVITECEAHPDCRPLNRCNLACRVDPDAGGCRTGCTFRYPAGEQGLVRIDRCGIAAEPQGCRDYCATTTP